MMYTRLFCFFVASFFCLCLAHAQDSHARRQRTPQEEAAKQTERLVRELGITDSVRIDTLYKMHLKYAYLRLKCVTRAENIKRMHAIYSELERLLTPDELKRFMNHPAEEPRRPHGACIVSPDTSVLQKLPRP